MAAQINIKFPDDLHRELQIHQTKLKLEHLESGKKGRGPSVNSIIVEAVKKYLAGAKKGGGK